MKKNVLITGASSGIGKELAHGFHEAGFNIIPCARRYEVLVNEFKNTDNCRPLKLDVTDYVNKVSDSRYLNPQAHKSWWSPEKMIKTLQELDFSEVYESKPGHSKCKYFTGKSQSQFIYDGTRPHMSLFVEAIK